MLDIADNRLTKLNCSRYIQQITFHQDNICRLNRNIGSGSDSDTNIRSGKSRSIVDTVTDHRHLLTGALQAADLLLLVLGEYLCHNTIHAYLTPNRFCGHCIVAGQHDHLNAHAGQFRYGLSAGGLDYICHGNDSNKLAITGKEQRCFPINGHFLAQLKEFATIDAVCRHQSAVSGKAHFVFNLTHKALAGNLLEIVHREEGKFCFFGLCHYCVCQRMLGQLFQRSSNLQQFLLPNALFAEHICHHGRTLGNCAGLIQHDRINVMGRFQGLC